MKRFVFREAQLLSLREQQVTIAELGLARASDQVALASQAVDSAVQDIEELSSRIQAGGQHGFTHISQTALVLRSRLEQANNTLNQTKDQHSIAVDSLRRAKVATESLLALRNAKMQKYKADRQKQLQAELDFHATRTWMTEGRHPHG